jgi:hypothetical protein
MDPFLLPHFDRATDDDEVRVPLAFLELAYPIPRDTRSHDDFERRRHLDLPDLSSEDLALEGYRVLLRLCFERDALSLDWLRERRRVVREEIERRRAEVWGAHHRPDDHPRANAGVVWHPSAPRIPTAAGRSRNAHRLRDDDAPPDGPVSHPALTLVDAGQETPR